MHDDVAAALANAEERVRFYERRITEAEEELTEARAKLVEAHERLDYWRDVHDRVASR